MNAGLLTLAAGLAVMALAFVRLAGQLSTREVAAVATLGALSAAGRVVFAPLPSVQPSTVLVILTGWVLGPAAGFTAGATTAFVSNVFLGQGPWTVWQMLAWGLTGAVAGVLGKREYAHPIRVIVVYAAVAGFAFSWLMDLWFWASFIYPHTVRSLLVTVALGLGFDIMHAAGNVVFALLFAEKVVGMLERFRSRMRVEYREVGSVG